MTAPVATMEQEGGGGEEETRRRKQAQVWFARGDTNPFGEPPLTLIYPTPSQHKLQKLIKSITVSFFGRLDQNFS